MCSAMRVELQGVISFFFLYFFLNLDCHSTPLWSSLLLADMVYGGNLEDFSEEEGIVLCVGNGFEEQE